ncbi:C40 family peptidase [Aestuariivivens insulae]|uniref:C40 family peptidase n=1 Tax=Aestuariivivens insulae TaxID=1621988 RepID=UPI001F5A8A7B|nr:C40 family peptidase [Aestuariivivens insulae]
MREILVILLITACFSSCKSTKRAKTSRTETSKSAVKIPQPNISKNTLEPLKVITLQDSITNYAKTFKGVKYKWGGTTSSGMDCSGLVFESFRTHHIFLPRISRDMAKKGSRIKLKDIAKGDLLFFKTGRSKRNAINHVGLVIEVTNKDIAFIHATTRKGVISSLLSETYWKNAFFEARRYID